MDETAELISPYMKHLKQETVKFEIQSLETIPTFYMDDDEEAPVVLQAADPQKILKKLAIVALINFDSDFECTINGKTMKLERSLTRQDHFQKIYEHAKSRSVDIIEDKSKHSSLGSIKISGLFVEPSVNSFDGLDFQLILLNGEKCEAEWAQEIVDTFFCDIMSFYYIIDISIQDVNDQSVIEETLMKCCRSMVKDFLNDFKDKYLSGYSQKIMHDIENEKTHLRYSLNGLDATNCNEEIDIVDLDDLVDESELETFSIITKSEYKWDTASKLEDAQEQTTTTFAPKPKRLLDSLNMAHIWLLGNEVELKASQVVDDKDDEKIINYKRKKELSNGTKMPTLFQKSTRIERPKNLSAISPTKFYNSPRPPFHYDIKLKSTRYPNRTRVKKNFDKLASVNTDFGALDKYLEEGEKNNNEKISYMDHEEGIILSSDDEEMKSQEKPKKFFTDLDMGRKRKNLMTQTLSKKPDFAPKRGLTKNITKELRGKLNNFDKSTQKITKKYMEPIEKSKVSPRMYAAVDDLLVDLNKPSKDKAAKTAQAKAIVEGRQLKPFRPASESVRGIKMLHTALNDIIKQRENDERKKMSALPGPSRPSNQQQIKKTIEIHNTPEKEVTKTPKLAYFDKYEVIVPPLKMHRAKEEINFDLMDEI